jgi:hypothetical protein
MTKPCGKETHNGKRTVTSISSVRKTEYPQQKNEIGPLSHYPQKITQNRLKDLHTSCKILEKNIEELLPLGLRNDFLYEPKTQAAIINKWDRIKLKSFYTAKETINREKIHGKNNRIICGLEEKICKQYICL